jgi:hypothetical protein
MKEMSVQHKCGRFSLIVWRRNGLLTHVSPRWTLLHSFARRRKAARKETLKSEKKGPGKIAHAKGTQKSAQSTIKQAAKKADVRPGPRKDKPTLLAESDNNHEEDEERLEGNQRRRLSLSTDRCENQGAE